MLRRQESPSSPDDQQTPHPTTPRPLPSWRFPTNKGRLDSLILAAEGGWSELVQILLEEGAELGDRDEDGRSAIQTAALCGFLSTVKALSCHTKCGHAREGLGDACMEVGGPALAFAAGTSRYLVTRYLLRQGEKPNATYSSTQSALALFFAACSGHTAIVELLLRHGANPSRFKGRRKVTALHLAVAVARLLVEAGADINAPAIWFGNPDETSSEGSESDNDEENGTAARTRTGAANEQKKHGRSSFGKVQLLQA